MSFLLVHTAIWLAILILLAFAAVQDIRARIIPNRVVLSVTTIGLVLGAIARPYSLWFNLVIAFTLLLGLAVLSHYDILGAGDTKLIAAVTLLVPPDRVAMLLFAIALAGGVLSAAYLVMYHVLKRRPPPWRGDIPAAEKTTGFSRWLRNERARIVSGHSVPYGVAILGGTAACFVSELQQCLSAISWSL